MRNTFSAKLIQTLSPFFVRPCRNCINKFNNLRGLMFLKKILSSSSFETKKFVWSYLVGILRAQIRENWSPRFERFTVAPQAVHPESILWLRSVKYFSTPSTKYFWKHFNIFLQSSCLWKVLSFILNKIGSKCDWGLFSVLPLLISETIRA